MHIGQAAANAVVVEGQAFVVDAQQMQHRGMEIVPMDGLIDSLPADVIGRAIGDTVASSRRRPSRR